MKAYFFKFLLTCSLAIFAMQSTSIMAEIDPLVAHDTKPKPTSQEQFDQLMAPIALYPDSLLSQILMASTYPADVEEAAQWSKYNEAKRDDQLKGDAAITAVADKNWDPSVASLVAFPQVLDMMNNKPDWVKEVGDAFLADSKKIMASVQSLRKKAQDKGNLESTEQQTVSTNNSSIIIMPTDPQVVYVPAYNPTVVYGTWWYPMYPPYYYPPPPRYGFSVGLVIGFGIGVGIHNGMWGGVNWGRGSVNINVNKYNNINVNNRIKSGNRNEGWKHNKAQQLNKGNKTNRAKNANAASRKDYRGRDAQRQTAMSNMKSQGLDLSKERSKLSGAGGDQVRSQLSNHSFNGNNVDRGSMKNKAGGLSNRSTSMGTRRTSSRANNAFSGMSGNSRINSGMSSQRGSSSNRSFNRGGGGGGRSFGGGGRRR